jgi:glyoxylase-like metal-dependent hydrolase (beta-lactamase superfamily II)
MLVMDHGVASAEVTAEELARCFESQEEIHILDVRAPTRLASGRIDNVPSERFHNIRGSELMALEDPAAIGLPRQKRVIVVCGRGRDSQVVAAHLKGMGFCVSSLRGGMVAWMGVTVRRELKPPLGLDRFVQFDRIGKGSLGYLLISDGEALIVDPPRSCSAYLELVEQADARVVGVAETHAHADYISGGPMLAGELGVPYYLHPEDAVSPYDGALATIRIEPIEDGRIIHLGRTTVKVVHTPGHTEGSVSYLLGQQAALTGDFLFIASVGRPDLGGKTEEWTHILWASLERMRREWPAGIRIYPAHYRSVTERNADRSIGSTLGELPTTNEPLAMRDRQQFLAWVMSKAGSFPEAYQQIKIVNLGLRRLDESEMDELEAGRNQCALG